MRFKNTLLAVGCLGLSATVPSMASAQNYKFKSHKAPRGAALIYEAINSAKDILAETVPSSGNPTCALLSGTTSTPISDPNGSYTQCYGIDSAGKIVGFYIPNSNPNTLVGFIYSNGTYTDFLANGSNAANGGTQLNAISANGHIIAGTYSDVNGNSIAFSLVNGNQQADISIPGQNYLVAVGVNNGTQVALQAFDVNGNLTGDYIAQSGQAISVSFPNEPSTHIHQINDSQVLAANFIDSNNTEHGFTYNVLTGTYSSAINVPNTQDTILIGINDKGEIVGADVTAKGAEDGLTATPKK